MMVSNAKRIFAILALVLLVACASNNVQTQKADPPWEQVEYHYYQGVDYYLGEDVEQSYTKAAEYFRLAVEQGHADAQGFLASLYDNVHGVAWACPNWPWATSMTVAAAWI